MKKTVTSLLLFCLILFSMAARPLAQHQNPTVVTVIDVSDLPDSEQRKVEISVIDKLEKNLMDYAGFSFIDSTNKDQILQLQRESESAAYDELSAIEVGKLTAATYALFGSVKKSGSKYIITIRYTDLTAGKAVAIVDGVSESLEGLYVDNGCAIDKLTIDLCDKLGIDLSPTTKHVIMHGDRDLSSDQKTKLYEDKVHQFEAQVADLNKKINSASISEDPDMEAYKAQLESEKKLADEKLKIAQENKKRAEEEAKKRAEEDKKDAKRSAAQKEKIDEMSQQLQEKYADLRNKKLANEPILGKIKVIELKKKALLEIQDDIDIEIERINSQANEKIEEKLEEITNRPISVVEQGVSADSLSDGAKKNRKREFEEEKQKIIEDAKQDAKQINDKLIKENKKLLNEIHKDYNGLKNITVSSLSDDLIVDFSNYDGNRGGWPLYVTVKSDDNVIFTTTAFLPYKELTGNDPIRDSRDPNYKDFALDVDTYESLFLRGEPILTFEVEYTVTPYAPRHPSTYKFKYNYLKYYDTRKMSVWGGKLRSSKTGFLHLDHDTVTRVMDPVYDISAIEANETASVKFDEVSYEADEDENINSASTYSDYDNDYEDPYIDYEYEEQKLREEEEKRLKAEQKARKKEESKKKHSASGGHPYDHSLFGINAGFGLEGIYGPSVEAELDFGFWNIFYWGLSTTAFFPSKAVGYNVVPDISLLLANQAKFGVSFDLYIVNVYCSVGLGANYFTYIPSMSKEPVKFEGPIPNDVRFISTIEVGGNIQLMRHLAVSCGYQVVYFDEGKRDFSNLDFGLVFAF